jgi:hypothetical protein
MTFGSILSKIPGVNKIPGVGNIGGNVFSTAGNALGKMAGAATENRGEADQLALLASRIYDEQMLDRERLGLDKRKDDRDMRNDAYTNALKASFLSNFQPLDRGQFKTSVPDVSFIKGGFGKTGPQAMQAMEDQALRALMSEPDTALPEATKFEPSKASFWERLAGPLGMASTIYGAAQGGPAPTAPTPMTKPQPPQTKLIPPTTPINKMGSPAPTQWKTSGRMVK